MTSVRVGKKTIRVRRVRSPAAEIARLAPGDPCAHDEIFGCFNRRLSLILIEKGRSPKKEAETLLHELLHALGLSEEEHATIAKLERLLFPILWRYGWRPFGEARGR